MCVFTYADEFIDHYGSSSKMMYIHIIFDGEKVAISWVKLMWILFLPDCVKEKGN